MSLPLPPEVLELIFGYLKSDLVILEACSLSHPIFSYLVERYLYTNLTFHDLKANDGGQNDDTYVSQPSKFNRRLSISPRIANYVRTVNVVIPYRRNFDATYLAEISSALQKLTSLKKISLCPSAYRRCKWNLLPNTFRQDFLKCLSLPSMEELSLARVMDFPVWTTTIKALSLQDCTGLHSDGIDPVYRPLNSLSIIQCESLVLFQMLPWINKCQLEKLAFQRGWCMDHTHNFGVVLHILASCSNSLTTLYLDISDLFSSYYNLTDANVMIPSTSHIPIMLSDFPHLRDLTVYSRLAILQSRSRLTMRSSIAAIANLVKTPSSIQRLTLDFFVHARPPIRFSPNTANWSFLVQLFEESSATSFNLDFKWDEEDGQQTQILASFASCAGLMEMVKEGVLVITPEIHVDMD